MATAFWGSAGSFSAATPNRSRSASARMNSGASWAARGPRLPIRAFARSAVRSKASRMAMDLYEELFALTKALDAGRLSYALCGGLAVAIHGAPRFTKDVG